MKKISRRSFLMATGTLAAATALTACSGGGSTGKANTAASSAPASSAAASEAADPSKYEVTEPITITWWHALETQYDELVTDIVDRFNKSQDLITVEPNTSAPTLRSTRPWQLLTPQARACLP